MIEKNKAVRLAAAKTIEKLEKKSENTLKKQA
jgi:hypothetical protein